MDIVVWTSAGAASAAALIMTQRLYAGNNIRAVYNPVAEEHHDNLRFLKDLGRRINMEIEFAKNFAFPDCSAETVWRERKFMAGNEGAPCTEQLKKESRRTWEDLNSWDGYHVFGFTVEEKSRHERRAKEGMKLLPVLIDAGMTKQDCHDLVASIGVKLPEIYSIASRFGSGYPNANCIGCVKATSATYWNHVRETFPEVFEQRAKLSRRLGAKLVRCNPKFLPFYKKDENGRWTDMRDGSQPYNDKGKYDTPRIYLDELPPDVKGRDMKTMKIDCGISCGIND